MALTGGPLTGKQVVPFPLARTDLRWSHARGTRQAAEAEPPTVSELLFAP
jgi:hypothetical protein